MNLICRWVSAPGAGIISTFVVPLVVPLDDPGVKAVVVTSTNDVVYGNSSEVAVPAKATSIDNVVDVRIIF